MENPNVDIIVKYFECLSENQREKSRRTRRRGSTREMNATVEQNKENLPPWWISKGAIISDGSKDKEDTAGSIDQERIDRKPGKALMDIIPQSVQPETTKLNGSKKEVEMAKAQVSVVNSNNVGDSDQTTLNKEEAGVIVEVCRVSPKKEEIYLMRGGPDEMSIDAAPSQIQQLANPTTRRELVKRRKRRHRRIKAMCRHQETSENLPQNQTSASVKTLPVKVNKDNGNFAKKNEKTANSCRKQKRNKAWSRKVKKQIREKKAAAENKRRSRSASQVEKKIEEIKDLKIGNTVFKFGKCLVKIAAKMGYTAIQHLVSGTDETSNESWSKGSDNLSSDSSGSESRCYSCFLNDLKCSCNSSACIYPMSPCSCSACDLSWSSDSVFESSIDSDD